MKKIIKKKTVDCEVFVAYDGTEFSAESRSIDDAKEQCEKYEQSAEAIVTSKAMKVLKLYKVPGSDKLSLDAVPESIKENMPDWKKHLYNPDTLAIHCIASELLTARWSIMDDNADQVYIFKPKKQSDIDTVVQYCNIKSMPINNWCYKETEYGKDLAAVLSHYNTECTDIDSIKVGHTYIVITMPVPEVTSVIDIEKVLSLWTEFLKDVEENY